MRKNNERFETLMIVLCLICAIDNYFLCLTNGVLMDEEFFKLFDSVHVQNIEEGVFYILQKGNLKIYLSHFIHEYDMADKNNNEAVVSAYRDHMNVLTTGGDMDHVLTEIKKIL